MRYRAAQRDLVARIDAVARGHLARAAESRAAVKRTGAAVDRRHAVAPRIITAFCTDADPRAVDLALDPSDRPYGSLFGRRPDLIDYGQVGFGRLSTPEAWLSTWSGLSTNADFVRCAPGVTVPTLFLELAGDQAAFPADTARMVGALGAADLTHRSIRGLHFGGGGGNRGGRAHRQRPRGRSYRRVDRATVRRGAAPDCCPSMNQEVMTSTLAGPGVRAGFRRRAAIG